MQREEFEQALVALIPQPDPDATAGWYKFNKECEESFGLEAVEILDSFGFIARNFNQQALQGVYEIIKYGAALPGEMVAAAIYLQNGDTPQHMAQRAHEGGLECFHEPETAEETSPLAVCSVVEHGEERRFYSLHFGGYLPEAAFRYAQGYALQHDIPVTQALRYVTVDLTVNPAAGDGQKILRDDARMTRAMFAIFKSCPAIAAHITYDADAGQVTVEQNSLWLTLQREQEQGQLRQEM